MTEILHSQDLPTITFFEDVMLGTTKHNHPLYTTAESDVVILNRILIDPESYLNLVSLFMSFKRTIF